MNLWFRVAMRVLARAWDFAWTGALTMFVVGAICGVVVGLCHLFCRGLLGRGQYRWLSLMILGALSGAFCGSIVYGVAGAMTSRYQNVEHIFNHINRWIAHWSIAGAVGGYFNVFCFLFIRHIYEGRAGYRPEYYILLFGGSLTGFFLLSFVGAILGARKAMREMETS